MGISGVGREFIPVPSFPIGHRTNRGGLEKRGDPEGLIKAGLEKCRGTFLYRLYRTFEIVDALGRGFQ